MIVKEDTDGSKAWINQAETLLGLNILKVGEELGIGTRDYNLIKLEPDDDDNDNDDKLTYIILGVIGGILFIGLIILLFLRRLKYIKEMCDQLGV